MGNSVFLDQIAEKGNGKVQYRTAKLYLNGISVPRDIEIAIQWFEKSAKQGYAAAQYELGKLFSHGVLYNTCHEKQSISQAQKDKENRAARRWFAKAAKQDFPGAFSGLFDLEFEMLFQCEASEWHTCSSGKKMYKWASKGAELKNKQSETDCWICYYTGIGTSRDSCKAMEWLEKIAYGGNQLGALCLAMLYTDGHDVPQNLDRAMRWYQKAMALGYRIEEDTQTNRQLQRILCCYVRKCDMTGFKRFAFPDSLNFYQTVNLDMELSTLFAPCIHWAKSKEICLEKGDEEKEVAYLPCTVKVIYDALIEISGKLRNIAKKNNLKMPLSHNITIEDFFPYCKKETIKRIENVIVDAWFFIKENFRDRFGNMSFLDYNDIWDYAEVEKDQDLMMILIEIVEVKIELESLRNSLIDIYQDLIQAKKNPDDAKMIKKIAVRFMHGNDTIPRSYSIAREWYSKIPDDLDAKINLAKINKALKQT